MAVAVVVVAVVVVTAISEVVAAVAKMKTTTKAARRRAVRNVLVRREKCLAKIRGPADDLNLIEGNFSLI